MDIVKRLKDAAALPNGLYAEAADEITQLRMALDALVHVVGLTAFKYESQREVLQEAVDIAISLLKEHNKKEQYGEYISNEGIYG